MNLEPFKPKHEFTDSIQKPRHDMQDVIIKHQHYDAHSIQYALAMPLRRIWAKVQPTQEVKL